MVVLLQDTAVATAQPPAGSREKVEAEEVVVVAEASSSIVVEKEAVGIVGAVAVPSTWKASEEEPFLL